MTNRVDPNDQDVLSTHISGIPALVHFFDVEKRGWGYWTYSWEVHDRKGYPAAWLERKLTSRKKSDIESEIIHRLAWAERERREHERARRKGMEDYL